MSERRVTVSLVQITEDTRYGTIIIAVLRLW